MEQTETEKGSKLFKEERMSGIECYVKTPCPAMRTEGGKDYCIKGEGECEYQILSDKQEKGEANTPTTT